MNPDVYQFLPRDLIPFSDAAKWSTREIFQAGLTEVLPDGEAFPDDKPPIVFISMNDSCEDVLKKIEDAPVVCDELRLAFDHRTCIRCGMKAKILKDGNDKDQKVACYAGEDPSLAMPYEESLCHPFIISKHWAITKFVGGIIHFITRRRFIDLAHNWLPDFHNPDDEICIACKKVPGLPGCTKIGSCYEGHLVDHTPTEPVPVVIQGQPGEIAINLDQWYEDIEANQCRHRTREHAAALNASAIGQQREQIGDDTSVQPQHADHLIDQAQEQEQPGAFNVDAPDLKG